MEGVRWLLWLYAVPALGTSRGLQIVSIVLCAVRFAALALMRRTQELIAVAARTSAAWLRFA
jgi:hypothetical protein